MRRYKSWSEAITKSPTSVAVLYASDYGHSDRLSQTLAHGITKAGVATEMVDLLSVDPLVSLPAQRFYVHLWPRKRELLNEKPLK